MALIVPDEPEGPNGTTTIQEDNSNDDVMVEDKTNNGLGLSYQDLSMLAEIIITEEGLSNALATVSNVEKTETRGLTSENPELGDHKYPPQRPSSASTIPDEISMSKASTQDMPCPLRVARAHSSPPSDDDGIDSCQPRCSSLSVSESAKATEWVNTTPSSDLRFHSAKPPGIPVAPNRKGPDQEEPATYVEVSDSVRMSKKRKRRAKDIGNVSTFLDLEAEVSQDDEDEDKDEDIGSFVVRDDSDEEEAGVRINYHAISSASDSMDTISEDRDFIDFHGSEFDPASFSYTVRAILNLWDRSTSKAREAIARRERRWAELGVRPVWILHTYARCQRKVIQWWRDFRSTFKDKKPLDVVTLYARLPNDDYLYMETDSPGLASIVFKMCRHVVRDTSGLNGIKMVQADVYDVPVSLGDFIETDDRVPSEYKPGTWVSLYTNPTLPPKANHRSETPPPTMPLGAADDDAWTVSQQDLSVNCTSQSFNSALGQRSPTGRMAGSVTALGTLESGEPKGPKPLTPTLIARSHEMKYYHGDAAIVLSWERDELVVLFIPRVPVQSILGHVLSYVGVGDTIVQCLYDPNVLSHEFTSRCKVETQFGLRVEIISTKYVKPLHRPLTPREGLLFFSSSHPLLAENFPRMSGWEFQVGDRVETRVSRIVGMVTAVERDGLYILGNDNIKGRIGWGARKHWKVGDLVEHSIHGWNGFVVQDGDFFNVRETVVTVRQVLEHKRGQAILREEQHTEVVTDPNFLIHFTPPQRSVFSQSENAVPWVEAVQYQAATLGVSSHYTQDVLKQKHPELLSVAQVDREIHNNHTIEVPWKFREVDVFAPTARGRARVLDVKFGCPTDSGLMVQVEWIVHGSSGARFDVNYDHVLDLSTQMPLHVVDVPRPPFVVRIGYKHPKYHPGVYYGASSSSRYLPPSGTTLTFSSADTTCDEETILSRKHSQQSITERPSSSPVTTSDQSIREMRNFLSSPFNIPNRRTWPDDAHSSHHWLYHLQGPTSMLSFLVYLTGKDDQLQTPFKRSGKLIKKGYTQLGDRCIFYKHDRYERILPNNVKVELQGITCQTAKALYVVHGEHAGQVVVRIATIPRDNRAVNQLVTFACCPVDVETGNVNASLQCDIKCGDACQIELEKEIFAHMYKQAEGIKQVTGVRRNYSKRRKVY